MILKYFAIVSTFGHRFFKYSLDSKLCFRHFSSMSMNTKPPNILVYTGDDSPKLFKEIENNILKCLKTDSYIVYHLLPSEINQQVWMENLLLLVVSSDSIEDSIVSTFERYFKNYGNILLICTKFDECFMESTCHQISDKESLIRVDFKDVGETTVVRGKHSYDSNGIVLCEDSSKNPLMQKLIHDKNILIMSEIYLDRDPEISDMSSKCNSNDRLSILKYILTKELGLEAKDDTSLPELSSGYYINDKVFEVAKIMDSIKLDDNSPETLIFHECKLKNEDVHVKVPIYFYNENSFQSLAFDKNLYFSKLHTKVYGHHLVYFPVITTTMDVAEQLSDYDGIVIVADYQVTGKGRGNNKWISPKGCAMFTLHITVPLCSPLGKKMTLLQHIASLAVVHGIKSQHAYKDLDLKVKWPNDIYCNKTKLGGLLVTSVVIKDLAHINIGWGINVENSRPTTCLNDIIEKYNSENASSLPSLCVEEVIAYTLSQMEYFVNDFIEFGSKKFFTHYYTYWMHSNQEVTLSNLNQQGIIVGLDEYGFLKVKTNDSKLLVLQPDGNRFDIMKNLIYTI